MTTDLIFSSEGSMCVNVTVTSDNALENDETFLVVLSSSDGAAMVTNNVTRVTILAGGGELCLCFLSVSLCSHPLTVTDLHLPCIWILLQLLLMLT